MSHEELVQYIHSLERQVEDAEVCFYFFNKVIYSVQYRSFGSLMRVESPSRAHGRATHETCPARGV